MNRIVLTKYQSSPRIEKNDFVFVKQGGSRWIPAAVTNVTGPVSNQQLTVTDGRVELQCSVFTKPGQFILQQIAIALLKPVNKTRITINHEQV